MNSSNSENSSDKKSRAAKAGSIDTKNSAKPIPSIPMTESDLNAPTPERRRRSAFLTGPAIGTEHGPARAGNRVHRALSVVDRLLANGTLEPRQADAADRLRTDYDLGIAGARDPAAGSASTTGWYYPEAQLAALRRYKAAVKSLGPLAPFVMATAIDDLPISSIAKFLRRNRQEVAGCVKLGLSTLADHYGIK